MPGEDSTAGLSGSGDEVDDAGRDLDHLLDDLHELEQRGGAKLRRLDHDGVAGREGGAELEGEQPQRVVPGNDGGHHPHRYPVGIGLNTGKGHAEGVSDRLVRQLTVEHEEVGAELLEAGGFGEYLAGVGDFETREALTVLGQGGGDRLEDPAAFHRRGRGPGAFDEGAVRGAHGPVHVLLLAIGEVAPRFLRRGVYRGHAPAARRIAPFTVDVCLK